jgi:hypothetical protein
MDLLALRQWLFIQVDPNLREFSQGLSLSSFLIWKFGFHFKTFVDFDFAYNFKKQID